MWLLILRFVLYVNIAWGMNDKCGVFLLHNVHNLLEQNALTKFRLSVGNVEFLPKKSSYHHDESVLVKNTEVVRCISKLLRVTEETLLAALTSKRARVSGEMLVINYRMSEVRSLTFLVEFSPFVLCTYTG